MLVNPNKNNKDSWITVIQQAWPNLVLPQIDPVSLYQRISIRRPPHNTRHCSFTAAVEQSDFNYGKDRQTAPLITDPFVKRIFAVVSQKSPSFHPVCCGGSLAPSHLDIETILVFS